jgi:hypothetical protein
MCLMRKYRQFLLSRQGKRVLLALGFYLVNSSPHLSAIENNGRGVTAIGMANAFVAVANNFWSIEYNPAGLAQLQEIGCSVFIVPEQFSLPELRTMACVVGIPSALVSTAVRIERFGFDLYKETMVGIAMARMIDQNIFLGMCMNWNQLDIQTYGSLHYSSFDGGLLIRIIDNINIGFSLKNILIGRMSAADGSLRQQGLLGICWKPISDLLLSLEFEKDIRFPVSLKLGVEKKFLDVIALRTGIADNPDKYSVGIAIMYSCFEFGYAGYSHTDLGWTHQVELTFKIEK